MFAFEAVETELPDLPLVAAPEASEVAPQVASCACGLLVPLEAVFSHRAGRKGGTPHFQKEGEHRETTSTEEHHQIVRTWRDPGTQKCLSGFCNLHRVCRLKTFPRNLVLRIRAGHHYA